MWCGVFLVVWCSTGVVLEWSFCGGVAVFLCLCFCGRGGVFVLVWWCFCVFVVVFLYVFFVNGRLSSHYREVMQRVLTTLV